MTRCPDCHEQIIWAYTRLLTSASMYVILYLARLSY